MAHQEQAPKQTVEIKVSFLFDERSQQEEYDTAINDGLNDLAERLNNQDILMLVVNVDAKVKMPCGHYEEVGDSLGGCYYNPDNEDITEINAFTFYKMVEGVQDQVIDLLGTKDVDFNVTFDKEIKGFY